MNLLVRRLPAWQIARRGIVSRSLSAKPVVELREYMIHPEHVSFFEQSTSESADLRKSLTPLRFFSFPETGGTLHIATHGYYYGGGIEERVEKREVMASNPDWQNYVSNTRQCVMQQKSNIYVEAPLVSDVDQVIGLQSVPTSQNGDNCILELRKYQLRLGYDTVPKFLDFYAKGLPSKLNAEGTDPTTSLVTLLYSEIGQLNEVIEIWRHGNGTLAMEQSRVAAREATEWRSAINSIASLAIEFTSTIHKPASFSPIK